MGINKYPLRVLIYTVLTQLIFYWKNTGASFLSVIYAQLFFQSTQSYKYTVLKMFRICHLLSTASLITTLAFTITSCSESDKTSGSASTTDAPKTTSSPVSESATREASAHPNFQGNWDFRTLTPLERPVELGNKAVFTAEEAEAFRQKAVSTNDTDNVSKDAPAELDVELSYNSFWMDFGTSMNDNLRTSLIIDPPNGRLPKLTPEAKAEMKTNALRLPPVRNLFSYGAESYRAKGPEALGLSERCLLGFNAGPPLTPSAYNNNLRIVQTPTHILLFTEMVHTARIIPINGQARLPEEMKEWSGDSRGHWEGDTLVIETTNFTDKTPTFQMPVALDGLENSGAVGSGTDMHLIERIKRANDSTLLYEYTLTDPKTFATPFTVVTPLRATDDQIFEYACHEGNHALSGMLKGARQMEKDEREKAKSK